MNYGSILNKVDGIIKLNQEAFLRRYIDLNMEVRKKAKSYFEKELFKLMNNSDFAVM